MWVLWAFALALLLKAAVPMLASAAAGVQGKTLVEVCTVYGVAMLPLNGDRGPGPADAPVAAHTGDDCALGAMLALAGPAPARTVTAADHQPAEPAATSRTASAPPRDAVAAWASRRQHAPPRFT